MKKVLIVGRPNVGKSSLFNRLIKKRRALVLDRPGVTRDIIKGQAQWWGHIFEVWDSGGLTWNHSSFLSQPIQKAVKTAIQRADLIVFVMDVHVGLHEDDKLIYKWVKNKKYVLVVNKVDHLTECEAHLSEFYALGEKFIATAFERDDNIDQIVDWVIQQSVSSLEKPEQHYPSLLITGQCNVGKSSLCNVLLKKDRMITSPKAHTTVDVVDEDFKFYGKKYKLLDTAGLRKHSRRTEDLEKISSAKTLSYFKRADIVFLVVDGSQSAVVRQDVRLFSYCMEKYKPCIIVVNKWDLANISKNEMRKHIQQTFSFFPDAPVVFVSALKKLGISTLMKTTNECIEKKQTHIPTSELNRFFKEAVQTAPTPVYGTKNVKFYYLTQIKKSHPSFIIFTNEPKGVTSAYNKFLIKKIQKKWSLQGIPIQTNFVPRK